MNHRLCPTLLLVALCLPTACTDGKADDSGTTMPPEPLQCAHEGELLDHGQEADSVDGCVTYACEDGSLLVVDDRRATVAGDLELATQAAVDERSCLGVVEGTLRITGTAADLSPLLALHRVGRDLEIVGAAITTTAGLEGLREVQGNVVIADDASLTTLTFQPAMSVFGDVTIQNDDALTSLSGAEFIGQCNSCMGISGRPTQLADHVDVQAAEGAEPAGDEGGLDQAGGTFYGNILIADNDALTSLQALSNLYYAWSDVRLRNNAALTSLSGLQQLVEVRGDLEVSEHAALPSVDAEALANGVTVLGATTVCGNEGGVPCS